MKTTQIELTDKFALATAITIYDNDETFSFSKGDDKFESVLSSLKFITQNSHEMPGFAVSLDNETKQAIQSGRWLELEFKKTQKYNDMPFDSLLIEVSKDYSGFNLIRKTNGKYEGRCFYLNLSQNMQPLYDTIESIIRWTIF